MSDIAVLSSVRLVLVRQNIVQGVHLALPPQAVFPFILIDLEELWSHTPSPFSGTGVQGRIKFRVSLYSQIQGMGEMAIISEKTRKILEGATVVLPENKIAILKFTYCTGGKSAPSTLGRSDLPLQIINQFYEAITRNSRN
jgi:hypothetical protein